MSEQSTGLVTGASGAIGRRLCARLQRQGWRVIALSTHTVDGPWARHVVADLGSIEAGQLSSLLSNERIAVVWHLAGRAHALDERHQDISIYERANLRSTKIVLAAARLLRVKRLVFASSVKVMGEGGFEIQDERAECSPLSAYGKTKLAAERWIFCESGDVEAVALRFCMVYGGGVKGNMARLVAISRRRWFPELPETSNRRCFVHVDDAVQACWLAGTHISAPGETFIVTDGSLYSTADLQRSIGKALSLPRPLWRLPAYILRWIACLGDLGARIVRRRLPFDTDALNKLMGSAAYSSKKISTKLDYQSSWPLVLGLRELTEKTLSRNP